MCEGIGKDGVDHTEPNVRTEEIRKFETVPKRLEAFIKTNCDSACEKIFQTDQMVVNFFFFLLRNYLPSSSLTIYAYVYIYIYLLYSPFAHEI